MGLGDVGILAIGARADLAVFDTGGRYDDPYAAVLDTGRCVATFLAGRPVHPV